MVMLNPWYTENNPSKLYQVPRQNSFQNIQSELNLSQTNQGPEENLLKNLIMEVKLRQQIFGKLIKDLDAEKKMSNNGMVKRNEKRSDCRSETTPIFRRIQDILH